MKSDVNIGTILNSVRKKKCDARKKEKEIHDVDLRCWW